MLKRVIYIFIMCLASLQVFAQSPCEQSTLFVRANISDWTPQAMSCSESGAFEIELKADAAFVLKFDETGDWKINYGDNDADQALERGGKPILVEKSGLYYITVVYDADMKSWKYDITEQIVSQVEPCGSKSLSLRLGSRSWGGKQMYCSDDNVWVTEVIAQENEQIVFDVYADWSLVYGDYEGDSQLDVSGSYIEISEAGAYQVHVDLINQQYFIVSTSVVGNQDFIPENECGLEQFYVRGSYNDWQAEAMACEDSVWVATVELLEDDILRFDAYGDWSEVFGDSDKDGALDTDGKNIAITEPGQYTVKVNYKEKTYLIELAQ